jgi:hypothetical protein
MIYNFQNTALDAMAGVASKTAPIAVTDKGFYFNSDRIRMVLAAMNSP